MASSAISDDLACACRQHYAAVSRTSGAAFDGSSIAILHLPALDCFMRVAQGCGPVRQGAFHLARPLLHARTSRWLGRL